jgi:hypothetical protein
LRRVGSLTSMAPLVRIGRRVPWARVLLAARWLYERGKNNLTQAERRELGTLLRKTKGDPRRLSVKERARVRNLVVKGATGRK